MHRKKVAPFVRRFVSQSPELFPMQARNVSFYLCAGNLYFLSSSHPWALKKQGYTVYELAFTLFLVLIMYRTCIPFKYGSISA
jgi:hypothetical protein